MAENDGLDCPFTSYVDVHTKTDLFRFIDWRLSYLRKNRDENRLLAKERNSRSSEGKRVELEWMLRQGQIGELNTFRILLEQVFKGDVSAD